ncbi:MAG: type I-E CRISPR-associated protein Cse2/CasB [Hyphomicrobiaceae bacterium]
MSLDDKIGGICRDLAGLYSGPLAELRRMDATSDAYGAPYFWRLCSRYQLGGTEAAEATWAQIIQALAILTPKGRDEAKPSRHSGHKTARPEVSAGSTEGGAAVARSRRRGLGHVLCDGADLRWPQDATNPKPAYSEARLAQLLGSSGETRIDLVVRAARFLSTRLPADATFDCTGIARLLLHPDDAKVTRDIARDYYARLDSARRTDTDDTTSNSSGDEA